MTMFIIFQKIVSIFPIQLLINEIHRKHEKSIKTIKMLSDDFNEEYANILNLVDILLTEKNIENEESSNVESEIKKIVDYLTENKIKVTKKKLLEHKDKVQANISRTTLKTFPYKKIREY